jgi:hypothetical protein
MESISVIPLKPVSRYALTLLFLGHLILPGQLLAESSAQAEAKTLLAAEKYQKAYTLLEKAAIEEAGDPEFDYLLGIAAMRAGQPAQAVFALERAVQTDPNYAAARMELVGAYVAVGLNQQAQDQLEILKTQNPPPAAQESMARFQDILRPRLSGTPKPVRLLGLSLGYDSNVGSYPDMGIDLGGLLLSVSPTESAFSLLRGTWWRPYKLSDERQLETTFHAQIRSYQESDATQFNLGLLHAGVAMKTDVDASNSYDLGLQANKLWLDNTGFRDHLGVSAFWEQRLDAGLQGRLGLKLHTYRFDPDIYNYDMTGLSGELNKTWTPQLRGALTLDIEQEKASNNRNGGDAQRYLLGGRMNFVLQGGHQLSGALTVSRTAYADSYAPHPLYNPGSTTRDRTDDAIDLNLQWLRSVARNWQLEADLDYRKQTSTVRFYENDRWTAQLTALRYF